MTTQEYISDLYPKGSSDYEVPEIYISSPKQVFIDSSISSPIKIDSDELNSTTNLSH